MIMYVVSQESKAMLPRCDYSQHALQVGVLSERAWSAAKLGLDSALIAMDGIVAARIQARIVNHILPALTASTGESKKGSKEGPPVPQPLQVTP